MTLIAHIVIDGNVRDQAGTNHGTWTGIEAYGNDSPTGVSTKSGSFDGASFIVLANESNFDFDRTDPFSVAFWFKRADDGTLDNFVFKRVNPDATSVGWSIHLETNGKVICELSNGASQFVVAQAGPAIDDNDWHFIVFTYAGASNQNGMKVYVDGVLDNTGAALAITGSLLNALSVHLAAQDGGGVFLTGFMRNVKIWNVELVAADVTQLNKAGFNRYGVGVSDGDDLP